MSIFVTVASYRDAELPKTIKSLYDNADDKDGLYFGIVNQDHKNKHAEFPYINPSNIKNYKMHFKDAKGAGYARKIGMSLYEGQDFFFQTDSHMRFSNGWDTDLKNMMQQAQELAQNQKVILSQFPAPYEPFTDGTDYYPKNDPLYWDSPSWTSVVNTWHGYWAGNREKIRDLSKPHKSHTVLAGLLFAPGNFVDEIPYDERISFMGEELCIALRAYTRGWDIYAPNKMIAWHFYQRKKNPKIWNDQINKAKWNTLEFESRKIQRKILLAEEEGVFGIADYQKYLDYQKMIGFEFLDVYENDLREKENLGSITQDIIFDDNFNIIETAKTGFCRINKHEKCFSLDICICSCHDIKGAKNARRK